MVGEPSPPQQDGFRDPGLREKFTAHSWGFSGPVPAANMTRIVRRQGKVVEGRPEAYAERETYFCSIDIMGECAEGLMRVTPL